MAARKTNPYIARMKKADSSPMPAKRREPKPEPINRNARKQLEALGYMSPPTSKKKKK